MSPPLSFVTLETQNFVLSLNPEINIWIFASLPLCFFYTLKADNDTFHNKILQTEWTKMPHIWMFSYHHPHTCNASLKIWTSEKSPGLFLKEREFV